METKATINVSKDVQSRLLQEIDHTKFFLLNVEKGTTDRLDLFHFALGLGLKEGERTPLSSKVGIVRTERLTEFHKSCYRAIYYDKVIKPNGLDIKAIDDLQEAINVVEEYANTGFIKLEQYMSGYDDETLTLKLLNEIENIFAYGENC